MKILVTGGAGYIGSNFVNYFVQNSNDQIFILDNLSKGSKNSVPLHLQNVHFVEADLLNREFLIDFMKENEFDLVLHFAARIEADLSLKEPDKFFDNNVLGTMNLLEAMRLSNCKKIVFSGTAAVYGNVELLDEERSKQIGRSFYTKITEDFPLKPINFYGASKLLVEDLICNYKVIYDFECVIFRYFNAAGAGMDGKLGDYDKNPKALIPALFTSGEKEFIIHGNDYQTDDGTPVRDFIHVQDLADAHIKAVEYLNNKGKAVILNLGNGTGVSVLKVIEIFQKVTGKKVNCKIGPRRVGDIAVSIADSSKAKNILDFVATNSSIEKIMRDSKIWYDQLLAKS